MRTVVFVLRGCPVGWLGAYGNEWVATPNLDRLAAESVVFDRHISDRPEAAAATAAWLGGSGLPVLSTLRGAGVHTVLVRANHPDTDGPGWFYDGWGEVFDARPQEEDNSPLDALVRSLPALLDRLAATPDHLLWIEIDRLIPPWDVRQDVFEAYLEDEDEPPEEEGEEEDDEEDDEEEEDEDEIEEGEGDEIAAEEEPGPPQPPIPDPPPPVPDEPATPWFDPPTGLFDSSDPDAWEWLHSSFAAVVTSLDAELGLLFEQLRARGLDQSAAWLLTSDFGYPLGEHGQIGPHRPWLHEELVHVPLMLRLPGAAEACRRVAGFTQPSDIAPTLLDLFGLKPAASLLPLAHGEGESHRQHAVTALELNGAAELAIRTEDWAYLLPVRVPEGETREPLLFGKPDDRWEVSDLRSRNLERADELEAELKKQD
jgi:arylsulfatase A-like enzyme